MTAPGRSLESQTDIAQLLSEIKTIAVLGIKPESRRDQPAFYVPRYMADAGYSIIPVPVYYPEITEILGKPVYRRLVDIPSEIDLVNVFRRAQDIPGHTADIIAKRPRAVWFQLGIRNGEVANELLAAGIDTVQDKCLMVEHRYI